MRWRFLFIAVLFYTPLQARILPSAFSHGFVNVTGGVETDYNVFIVFPVMCFGATNEAGYEKLGILPQERASFQAHSDQLRVTALTAILYNLEAEGFPYDSMPEEMKAEYDAVLQDSAVVVVTGPELGPHTPIYGVWSLSYDWGEGTAGERRLGERFPREVSEAKFLDFHVRNGRGPIAIFEADSLLFSSRLWFTGGNSNIAEIKTLEITRNRQDLEDQAKRLKVPVEEVRAQVLAILQHITSSFLLTGKESLPAEYHKLIPPEALLSRRIAELDERITRAAHDDPAQKRALIEAMRRHALNPPPQEFSLINNITAYVGGIDPRTGRDLINSREQFFRSRFPIPERLGRMRDPNIPQMTLARLQGTRGEFDSGAFLRKFSPFPAMETPRERGHLIIDTSSTFIYGPISGVHPPRLSELFNCEHYLAEYSKLAFGRPRHPPL